MIGDPPVVDDQPYRQPKPEPLTRLLRLLGDEPIVIYDDPEGWHAYEAWLPTIPDNLAAT